MGKKSAATAFLTGIIAFVSGGWLLQSNSAPVYERARLFDDIVAHVATYYVDSITESELYDMAIDGMLNELNDPYTNFLRRDAFGDLTLSTTGDYAGVGIQIDSRDSWITVVSVFPDTPGEIVGLQSGDQIVEIDGESTEGWSTQQASVRMRGAPHTDVNLTVQRAGLTERLNFTVTRARIHVSSVEGQMVLDGDVGYMRLTSVTDVSAGELAMAIEQVRQQGATSLILDLRGNPGGILTQGVALADLFLDSGLTVVETRGRAPGATETYRTRNRAAFGDLLLVVLVNGFTASAAEIISGALQDHDRGLIMGTPSFGKGVAYLVFQVSDTEAVSVTTSRWYTPVGRSIDRPRSERHPLLAGREPSNVADTVFLSMAGRQLRGGGGIEPDIVLPDTLTDGEQRFARALGTNVPAYRNVVTRYARELQGQNIITEPRFEVTAEMRTELRARLATAGIELSDADWNDGAEFVAHQLGYETARYVFGRTGELRRRAGNDIQIMRAIELLAQASSPAELISLAEGSDSVN